MPRGPKPAGVRARVKMQMPEGKAQMPRRGLSDSANRAPQQPARPKNFDESLAEMAGGQLFSRKQLEGDSSVAANLLRFRRKLPK